MSGNVNNESAHAEIWVCAVNAIKDPVFLITTERIISNCNEAAAKFLKNHRDKIVGSKCSELFYGCENIAENCPLEKIKNTMRRETVSYCAEGKVFEATADPMIGQDGGLNGAVFIIRDATDRRSKYEASERNARRWKEIIDSSSSGYAVAEAGRIVYASERFSEIMGYDKGGDATGTLLAEHIHGSDMEKVCDALEQWEKGAHGCQTMDVRIVCRKGLLKTVRMEWQETVIGGAGKLVLSARDVTTEKELEEMKKKVHLYKSQETLGRVAGRVAHDFNNIMGITLGMSQMMLFDQSLSEEMKKYASAIKETSARGREITRNLTFFAGSREPRFQKYDFFEKLTLITGSMREDLKDVRLCVECSGSIGSVTGDPALLTEILTQLLRNSVHATSKTINPIIAIGAEREHGGVSIIIGDNGCGIPKEYHEDIFEPTFTLKGSQDHARAYKDDVRGSGYGLSNAKKCVELHRGNISFSSEKDAGALFRVWLPDFEEIHLNNERCAQDRSEVSYFSGKNILVVEDEVNFANLLSKTLINNRNNVDVVMDGKAALEALSKKHYDAVSLDCMLPDASGIEIYSKIREMNSSIPIVFVSGAAHFLEMIMEIRSKDYSVGHLLKPFDNLEYVHAINRIMAARQGKPE